MVYAFGGEFPDGIKDADFSWVRRPLVLIKGKPITSRGLDT